MFRLVFFAITVTFFTALTFARPSSPGNLRLVPDAYRQLNRNYPAIADIQEIHNLNSQIEAVAVYFLSLAKKLNGTAVEAEATASADKIIELFSTQLSNNFYASVSSVMTDHKLNYRQAVLVLGLRTALDYDAAELAILEFATEVDQLNAAISEIKD